MSNFKILIIILAVIVIGGAGLLIAKNKNDDTNKDQPKDKVTLALDWTPNTNHTGIYAAQQNGWYAEENIELEIIPYASTPSDVLVSSGKADVGIGFTEGVVASAATDSPVVSIAAIISNNTSSIATRASDNIDSLADLDGKIYGGYGAPYEEPVMRQAIENDGGEGDFKQVVVNTAPIDALESKKVDFVWIYDGWEGIEAKRRGFDIKQFPVVEHGIPDYSTPNIITSPQTIAEKSDVLERFMKATSRGYEFARLNANEAATLLIKAAPAGTFPDEELVYESQRYLSPRYQSEGKAWGLQDPQFWRNYPEFMVANNAVVDVAGNPIESIDFDSLYTNEFLE
ncbi:MAG TPA: ABC transporter substrate-binding protein [Candidatus Saccharimonadales bacterium]|nr:ABC transporter substrate-binding protein [Candidatus Saccharimonadales bacterium]